MPLPAWVFEVENFNPPPDEELICSICRCVFRDPVECPCRHVFCSACISNWFRVHRNCPICRKETNESTLCPVVPLINNMIMKMTLKCPNASNGCTMQMKLEGCECHLNNCLFALVECSNECGNSFFRRDLVKHETEECALRSIECRKCNLKVQGSLDEHNCITALKQIIDDRRKVIEELRRQAEKLQTELNRHTREHAAHAHVPLPSHFDTSSGRDADPVRSDISDHDEPEELSSSNSYDSDSADYFIETGNENSNIYSRVDIFSSAHHGVESIPVIQCILEN